MRRAWRGIRDVGPAGAAYLALALASEALALYAWVGRQAGCTNRQAHDPRYFCPSGAHVLTVWLLFAATIALAGLVGMPAVRERRDRRLRGLAVVQLAVVAALVWISQAPSYHAHLR